MSGVHQLGMITQDLFPWLQGCLLSLAVWLCTTVDILWCHITSIHYPGVVFPPPPPPTPPPPPAPPPSQSPTLSLCLSQIGEYGSKNCLKMTKIKQVNIYNVNRIIANRLMNTNMLKKRSLAHSIASVLNQNFQSGISTKLLFPYNYAKETWPSTSNSWVCLTKTFNSVFLKFSPGANWAGFPLEGHILYVWLSEWQPA